MRGHILVIDDEEEVYEDLKFGLGQAHEIHYANTLSRVNGYLKSYSIDLVFVDLNMKIGNEDRFSGIDYIKVLRTKHPTLTIIVLSGYSDESLIVKATKNGADDYWVKDSLEIDSPDFREKVRKWVNAKKKLDEKRNLDQFNTWGSPAFSKEIIQNCMDFTQAGKTFLLSGEEGSGKRQLLRQTYAKSKKVFKADKEPDTIYLNRYEHEDIEKFLKSTAAVNDKKNFLKNPTVKLQYIIGLDSLPIPIQELWLKLIISQKFIGEKDSINHQLVFILEKDPEELIKEGKLSPSWASKVSRIVLPPLRKRREELSDLIKNWQKHNGAFMIKWTQASMNLMRRYPFPGNLVELYAILEEIIAAHKKQFRTKWEEHPIQPESLPKKLQQTPSDLLDGMHFEVARVHLKFIEAALIAFAGDRRQKDLAAKALEIHSGDNMKKTFINKYWEKYPELVKGFPTIMKKYKLDDK